MQPISAYCISLCGSTMRLICKLQIYRVNNKKTSSVVQRILLWCTRSRSKESDNDITLCPLQFKEVKYMWRGKICSVYTFVGLNSFQVYHNIIIYNQIWFSIQHLCIVSTFSVYLCRSFMVFLLVNIRTTTPCSHHMSCMH